MKRTFLVIVLMMALILSFNIGIFAADDWDGTVNTEWYTGAPSGATSYEISTPAQLAGLASLVNEGTDTFSGKTVTLTANLDLGGVYADGAWDAANSKNWTMIGTSTSSKQFAGVFNGNGKTISNLYLNSTATYQGLFGYIGAAAKIKNLSIVSGSITSTGTNIAGIAGYCNGIILNCSNAASITGAGNIGGIVGTLGGAGSIINTFNTGDLAGTSTSVRYLGGIASVFNSTGTILNCYNLGDLNNFGLYGGGLVAQAGGTGKIVNCYNAGNVTASSSTYVSNVIGRGNNATYYMNVYGLKTDTINSSLKAMVTPSDAAFESAALKDSATLAGLASTLGANFKAAASGGDYTYPVLTWQEGGSYTADETDGMAISSLTVENGTATAVLDKALTYTKLDKSQFSLTKAINGSDAEAVTISSITQTNGASSTTVTIKFTAIEATTVDQSIVMAASYWGGSAVSADAFAIAQSNEWPAYGVQPANGDGTAANPYLLGTAENLAWFCKQVNDGNISLCAQLTADIDLNGKLWPGIGLDGYTGTFDGDGYVIKNMEINASSGYMGFFNNLSSGSFVKNLGIESGSITVTASSTTFVGGICGQNQGVILNCFNKVDLTTSGVSYVGGIAGGCMSSGSAIVNCYNTGEIVSDRANVGGIAGYLGNAKAVIVNVYNTGSVTSTASGDWGGEATSVGGIVGCYANGAFSNAYNAGAVDGGSGDYGVAGGIVGLNMYGTAANCYFLSTLLLNYGVTGIGASYDSSSDSYSAKVDQTGIVAVDSSALQALTSSLGSAFAADSANVNSGYPILSWQAEGASYPSDELDGLAIESVRAENGKVYVTLNKQLSYRYLDKGNFSMEMHLAAEPEYYSMTISSISQDNSGAKTIVTLSFSSYAETNAVQAGLVRVSYLGATAVEGNMAIAASLEWYKYASSGFAGGEGSAESPYQIATAEQLVYLSNRVLLGETYAGKYFIVTNDIDLGGKYWQPIGSYNNSNTTACLAFAGNFDGQNYTIQDVWIPYSGTSTARYQYAGLFGWNTGNISNLQVTGLVQGKQNGGISARNEGAIDNCDSYVDLHQYDSTGAFYMGGIAAYSSGSITNCLNYGDMKSSSSNYGINYISGIAGYVNASANDVTISRCANYGNIDGYSYLGGIAGRTVTGNEFGLTIEECFNAGQISGKFYVAGIAGSATAAVTIRNCYNSGDIYGMTASTATVGNGGITVRGGEIINCYSVGNLSSIRARMTHIVSDVISANLAPVTNCYYLEDGIYAGATSASSLVDAKDFDITPMDVAGMQAADFVNALNGEDGTAFVADTENVNNGYPVLSWAAGESDAPTGLTGGENKITGLDTEKNYEYKNSIDNGYTAVDVGSSEITDLNSGAYYVRFAETGTKTPSGYAVVNVGGDLSGSAYIPIYTDSYPYIMYDKMCYVNMQGLPVGATLSYQWFRYENGKYTRISGATDRTYVPVAKDIGCYLYVEIYAEGYDGSVSATSESAVTKQKTVVTGLTVENCSAVGVNDGKITGLDAALPYEYKLVADSEYTEVEDGATEISGLAPGNYNVRCRETDLFFSSSDGNYTVSDYATALAAAKTTAKNGLITALAGYAEADFSTDNWTALSTAKTAGDAAIDAATTLEAVALAKEAALEAMDAIKTLAEAALETTKSEAKTALADALAAYDEDAYFATEWAALNQAKTDGDAAIDAATDADAANTAKQAALDAMAAVKTKTQLNEDSVDRTVTLDAQANNEFIVAYQSVSVNSSLAESYGYSDGMAIANGVSALDVLVKAHEINYGSAFDGSQLIVASGMITKIFGIATSDCGFAINGVQPHGDTLIESNYGDYYEGYAVTGATVADNDFVEFYLYQDDYYLDNYAWFEQNGAKVDTITAKAGDECTVTLKGYAIAWYGCSEASVIETNTAALSDAQLALVAADGAITDIDGAVTAADGSITLEIATEGSYLLTAYMSEEEITDGSLPLIMPIAALNITAAEPLDPVVDVKDMTDVSESAWYYSDVAYVLAQGIMKGESPTTFNPNGDITRGQFVTILGRYAGMEDSSASNPATTSFTDVNQNQYYAAHVAWAAENGITTGTSATTFDPNAQISRQDMATMIGRFAKVMEIDLPDGDNATLFADDASIASYAKASVYSMVEAGIISGVGNNKFDPKATATRGQAAKIIHLLMEYK